MSSLFISYSRKDIEFARKLTEAFTHEELDFWIDWEGIPPTVDWWKEIQKGIEEADVFLFLISPDSSQSKVCKQEIEHAAENGKRLIPIVVRDISGGQAPPELSALNWIFLRATDDFDASFRKLMTAIKTDYEWVQIHRQLQVKALEWERNNHENSFLLRGKELQDAEKQLSVNSSKEPYPTELQRNYVLKSRQAADRQTRITTIIAVAGVIALAVLAISAFVQAGKATKNAQEAQTQTIKAEAASVLASDNAATAQANAQDAKRQANIAKTRELSAQAELNLEASPSRALLLAVEAAHISQNANIPLSVSVQQSLYDTLGKIEGDALPGSQDTVKAFHFTQNSKWLLVDSDYNVQAWNAAKPWGSPLLIEHANYIRSTSSGRVLLGLDTNLEIWDFSTDTPQRIMQFTFDHTYGQDAKTQNVSYIDRHGYSSQDYAISPDGRWFGILNVNKSFSIFDLNSPQQEPSDFASPYTIDQSLGIGFSVKGDWLVIQSHLEGSNLYRIDVDQSQSRLNIQQEMFLGTAVANHVEVPNFQFSSDGRWLLASGTNVELWDISRGNVSSKTVMSENLIYFSFSDDSRYLIRNDQGKTSLWKLPEQQITADFADHFKEFPVSSQPFFNVDGNFVLLADQSTLYLWNSANDIVVDGPRFTGSYIWDAHFLPDPAGFVVLTDDGKLTYYSTDFAAERSLGTFPGVYDFSLANEGRFAIIKDTNQKIHILDLRAPTAATVEKLAITQSYDEFTLSNDGRWLIAGSISDRVPRLWDLSNLNAELAENTIRVFPGGQDPSVTGQSYGQNPSPSFVLSADGKWMANIAGSDGQLFDLSGSIAAPIFLGNKVKSLAISPDNNWLGVYSGPSNAIHIWNLNDPLPTQESTYNVPTGKWALNQIAFSPDGKWFIASTDWQVFVLNWKERASQHWQVLGPEPPTGYGGGGGGQEGFRPGQNLAFSPDGRWLGFGRNGTNDDLNKFVWDTENFTKLPLALKGPIADTVNNMLFSSDGRWLVIVPSAGGVGVLWDLTMPDPNNGFKELIGNGRLVSAIAFSPDNHWLATGHGNDVYLWDLTSSDPSRSPIILQGHTQTIWSLAFSSDSKMLASGSRDKTIHLWDMQAKNIATSAIILYGHTGEVYDIAFTDHDAKLVSNSLDGTTRLWDLNFDEMLRLACKKAGRNFSAEEWLSYFDQEAFRDVCAVSSSAEAIDNMPASTPVIQAASTLQNPGVPTEVPATIASTPTTEVGIQYTVQPGDSLTSIALKFNVTVEAIIQDNKISDPNSIQVGQILIINPTTTQTTVP